MAQRGLLTSNAEEEHSGTKFDDTEYDLNTPTGDCLDVTSTFRKGIFSADTRGDAWAHTECAEAKVYV